METTASNPDVGTGEFDAQSAFASILAVEDGEQKQGEAPEAEVEDTEAETEVEAEDELQDSSEEEAESEGEEESEEQEEQPPVYKVKVDGEEVEVTLDELQKGYSRTQDYTRKTQALADQRKAVEAEMSQVRQEREYYAQMLTALEQQLSQAEAEPNWDQLYQENPTEWVRQRELWRDKQEKQAAIKAEQARLARVAEQEMAKSKQEQLSREAERLLDAIPEWKDAKKAAEERGKLVEAGRKAGFTEDELGQVVDHRAIVLLRKAALYDELMSKKSNIKPVPAKGPRPATPGSASNVPSKKTEAARARERLAKTGSINDAAAAFDDFI